MAHLFFITSTATRNPSYFTDPTYGYDQGFRPAPVLPEQAYRFDPDTGLVGVAADGFVRPNGKSHC
jgi:sugar lactone lactonase YvrE